MGSSTTLPSSPASTRSSPTGRYISSPRSKWPTRPSLSRTPNSTRWAASPTWLASPWSPPDPAHGALPRRAPPTRCTADLVHRVWLQVIADKIASLPLATAFSFCAIGFLFMLNEVARSAAHSALHFPTPRTFPRRTADPCAPCVEQVARDLEDTVDPLHPPTLRWPVTSRTRSRPSWASR